MAEHDLVLWMEDKRAALGLTHDAWARTLGISLSVWGYYRSGLRRPSLRTAQILLRTFPGDRSDIYAAIERDPPTDTSDEE